MVPWSLPALWAERFSSSVELGSSSNVSSMEVSRLSSAAAGATLCVLELSCSTLDVSSRGGVLCVSRAELQRVL